MISHCKRVGDIGEANVIAKLLTYDNVNVSKPVGDNCQYDLVLDVDGRLYRAQVKTTEKVKEGKMFYFLYCRNKKDHRRYYKEGEVDVFLFYCIETDYVGMATYKEIPQKTFTLNTIGKDEKIGRNVAHKIRYSVDFELEKKIKEL